MIGKFLASGSILGLLIMANPASAKPEFQNVVLDTPGNDAVLILPNETSHSSVIFLGTTPDPRTGELVEGYAFVHYKDRNAGTGDSISNTATQCYRFLAEGAKWKNVESWLVNPQNIRGLTPSFILNNLTADISKWEDASDGVIDNISAIDVLGNGAITYKKLKADTGRPDGKNEIYFANVSSSGAIAVTIVWGIFSDPDINNRKLVEWDQVYDDRDYDWSQSGEAGKMDFENIATHELGHSVGMDDLDNTACSNETMYGYADYSEILKRDLFSGDIEGIDLLY